MEEMSSLYGYESMDNLKHKLLYTNLELQKMKMKANVTLREHKDTVQHLLNLLGNAYKERDGARDQLQKLIYKSMSSTPGQILSQVQPESPILNMPPEVNLSKSESNSEAYNHLSRGSSSVDSFFDAASSPDFPSKNMAGSSNMGLLNQPFAQERHIGSKFTGLVSSGVLNNVENDRGIVVIDYLAQGKVLPQMGKLLQAVMDAGPLLQSLLVTGPLPQWRNPPPHPRPTNILPDSTKGHLTAYVNHQKPDANPNSAVLRASNSSSSNKMSHLSQFMSNSTEAPPSCSGLSNARMLTSSASTNSQNPLHKRQRLM